MEKEKEARQEKQQCPSVGQENLRFGNTRGGQGADLEHWRFVLPTAQAFGEKQTRSSLMAT